MSVFRATKRTARKKHVCEGCWFKTDTNPIEPGTEYYDCFSAGYGGDAGGYKLCVPCYEFMESDAGYEFMKEGGFEFSAGDLHEARTHLEQVTP